MNESRKHHGMKKSFRIFKLEEVDYNAVVTAAKQSNADNPNNVRRGHLRNKKREYLKDKINDVDKTLRPRISEICRGDSVTLRRDSNIEIQGVQLKRGPYFNMSNLFTKIYNMLYYTTNLYLQ
jgi:hypothetical protein